MDERLDLCYQELTKINLRKKKKCKYLDLTGNNIQIIDGYNLPPNLTTLIITNCCCNTLVNLPPTLEILQASNNLIRTVFIPNSLIEVSLTNNMIESIVIEDYSKSRLQKLKVNHNMLSKLPKLPNTLLRLEVAYNRFSKYPYLLNTNIQYLKINNNCITHNNKIFDQLRKMTSVIDKEGKNKIKTTTDISITNPVQTIKNLNIHPEYNVLLQLLNQSESIKTIENIDA